MYNQYDRRHVNEVLITMSNKIHPAISFGRNNEIDKVTEEFVLTFFLTRTPDEIKEINSLIKSNEDEVLVVFYQERINDAPHVLSYDEMKSFDFTRSYKVYHQGDGFDEIREIAQPMLAITFSLPEE